jgi:excinuclease UvrABC helicase subunit UvrB
MYQFAENLEFEKAARTRDRIEEIRSEYLKT